MPYSLIGPMYTQSWGSISSRFNLLKSAWKVLAWPWILVSSLESATILPGNSFWSWARVTFSLVDIGT